MNYKCLCSILFNFLVISNALAWQVKGRTTLPSDCRAGETWVRDHSKPKGNWTSFCRVLRGSSTHQPKFYKFWASKIQPSRPKNWPFPEASTDWQIKDIADVLWAVEQIPEELWDPTLRGLYRMNKSRDYPNPGINWENYIVLYDSAFQNEQYLKEVLIHELAHRKFRSYPEDKRINYAKSCGWKVIERKNGDTIFESPECCYVKADGQYSIDEDFANNIEYYLERC